MINANFINFTCPNSSINFLRCSPNFVSMSSYFLSSGTWCFLLISLLPLSTTLRAFISSATSLNFKFSSAICISISSRRRCEFDQEEKRDKVRRMKWDFHWGLSSTWIFPRDFNTQIILVRGMATVSKKALKILNVTFLMISLLSSLLSDMYFWCVSSALTAAKKPSKRRMKAHLLLDGTQNCLQIFLPRFHRISEWSILHPDYRLNFLLSHFLCIQQQQLSLINNSLFFFLKCLLKFFFHLFFFLRHCCGEIKEIKERWKTFGLWWEEEKEFWACCANGLTFIVYIHQDDDNLIFPFLFTSLLPFNDTDGWEVRENCSILHSHKLILKNDFELMKLWVIKLNLKAFHG